MTDQKPQKGRFHQKHAQIREQKKDQQETNAAQKENVEKIGTEYYV